RRRRRVVSTAAAAAARARGGSTAHRLRGDHDAAGGVPEDVPDGLPEDRAIPRAAVLARGTQDDDLGSRFRRLVDDRLAGLARPSDACRDLDAVAAADLGRLLEHAPRLR